MRASPLPAPLHTAPSFLKFPFLTIKDKLVISRAIAALTLTQQPDTGRSFLDWCQRHGQTGNAIDRFWKPILVSALSEDLGLISISYAAQVVRESMKSPAARHMGVPSIPLTELYNAAGDYIRARGGDILFHESCRARGIATTIVLPFAPDLFLKTSVEGAEGEDDWPRRFQKLWDETPPSRRHDLSLPQSDEAYALCNDRILELAKEAGEPQMIALWDGSGGDDPGGTAHFLKRIKESSGLTPEIIDPKALAPSLGR